MSNDSFNDEFDDGRAAKPGMSTGVKVLIGLLVGGGILGLLCCGGMIYLGKQAADGFKVVETPAEVDALTKEIIQIDIPEQFTGKMGMKLNFIVFSMEMAVYEGVTSDSQLMIIQTTQPGAASPEEQMEEIKRQMEQQGQSGEFDQQELQDAETETKSLTVRGQPVDFQFTTGMGEDGETTIHQISGAFPSGEGLVILMIQMPDEDYNEEEIVKMIESIQ